MSDEAKIPSNLESLDNLLGQMGNQYRIFESILAVLQEHQQLLYACREDTKLARATAVSADRRASETMMKLAVVLQELRKK